jgi:cytochrome c oxidase subunit 3
VGIIILFLAVVGAVAAWWLAHQRLMAKPWLEAGPIGDVPGTGGPPLPAAKIGLGVFIVVASALFVLFLSAYAIRMQMGDWRPLPAPHLLWFNTLLLVLSSVALQWSQAAARRGDEENVKTGIIATGIFSLAFLAGQILAWFELVDAGYGLASNPANTFFYLLTAAHGLHVLGGLVALARTAGKVWRGVAFARVRLSVELCAVYWHFLLLVWLVLFALLLVQPGDAFAEFLARCVQFIPGTR